MISAITPYRPLLPPVRFGVGATQAVFGKITSTVSPTASTSPPPPSSNSPEETLRKRWSSPWPLTQPQKLLRNIGAWLGTESNRDLKGLTWKSFNPNRVPNQNFQGRFIQAPKLKGTLRSVEAVVEGSTGNCYSIRLVTEWDPTSRTHIRLYEEVTDATKVLYRHPYSRASQVKPIIPPFHWSGWDDLLHATPLKAATPEITFHTGKGKPERPPGRSESGARLKTAA